MNVHAYPHHVSRAPGLPSVNEQSQDCCSDLRDLRRCQTKTFRKLLQIEFNRGLRDGRHSKLSLDGMIMLMGVNR